MTDLPDILARATRGPWSVDLHGVDNCLGDVWTEPGDDAERICESATAEDAALIALAPQLAEALIEAHKAMTELQRDMLERSRSGIDAIHGEEYRIVNAGRTAWHDFCATLTRIDAIMNPGGGALKGD